MLRLKLSHSLEWLGSVVHSGSDCHAKVVPASEEIELAFYGHLRVSTYRFELDDSRDSVAPKDSIESAHRPHVESAIEEEGFRQSR